MPEPLPSARPGEAAGAPARVRWRFRSASPVTGPPAISATGLVYVSSVEGYVHALDADGGFRWSYGLRGVPLGAPAVDAAGRVFVATSAARLYALRADGQLAWTRSARARFAAAPVWAEDGLVYFAGRDQGLYCVPGAGGPLVRRELGEPAGASLASLPGGLIALGTAGGARLYRGGASRGGLALGGAPSQPLLGGDERWYAVTSHGISAHDVDTRALLWSAPARRAALSADQGTLLIEADRELRWLSPHTGEVLGRARLPGDVSATPAVTNAGVALVPLVSGELWVVDPLAPGAARVGIGSAPLRAPVHDEARASVTVAGGAAIAALHVGREPAPGSAAGAPVVEPGSRPRLGQRPRAVRGVLARPEARRPEPGGGG